MYNTNPDQVGFSVNDVKLSWQVGKCSSQGYCGCLRQWPLKFCTFSFRYFKVQKSRNIESENTPSDRVLKLKVPN